MQLDPPNLEHPHKVIGLQIHNYSLDVDYTTGPAIMCKRRTKKKEKHLLSTILHIIDVRTPIGHVFASCVGTELRAAVPLPSALLYIERTSDTSHYPSIGECESSLAA